MGHGKHRGLGPALNTQLAQYRGHIVLDCLLSKREGHADLPVRQSFGDVVQDSLFLR